MSTNNHNQEYLDNLRHSAAHLLAAAVLELYPEAKPTIGPPIEDGFYYDFDNLQLSADDLPKIEEKMAQIVKKWKSFERIEVSAEQAQERFSNNEYKLELINEFSQEGQQLSLYKAGDFTDLCRGGHVDNPAKELKHFKLLSLAGAYWRGDEKKKMLTRIYGTAFTSKKELSSYLKMREEAKLRDHRKIGKAQELFLISQEIGTGFPILAPKGLIIRRTIENFLIDEKEKRDYQFVWSPHVANSEIYKKSGHWQKYDAMFSPMKVDDDDYVVKPMNCPHHFQVYLMKPRSYKELPLRIAENGTCYRNEKSGELSGLLRVRSLTIDDTHTFVRPDQIGEEIDRVLELIETTFKTFGFADYRAQISIRDPKEPDKYLGDAQTWARAEQALVDACKKRNINFTIEAGEAAFYGPKIDIMVKDSLGRRWQLSTVQLDFNQPENFDMSYVNEQGEKARPAILHIAILGSIERFMGILIEHYSGTYPLWLSPVQVQLIPVSEAYNEIVQPIAREFKENNIRVHVDEAQETVGNKIRKAERDKVPYMLVIGEKEAQGDKFTLRVRGKSQQKEMDKKRFVKKVVKEIKERK